MKTKVAVLMGGSSAEREVSLATGLQVLNALDPAKYEVVALDTQSGNRFLPDSGMRGFSTLTAADGTTPITSLMQLSQVGLAERPNVVFIALHGPGGEDGTVQGYLETLHIPYTGSGVLASALAMDKARCKAFLGTENIITPPGMVFYKSDGLRLRRAGGEVARSMGFPVIVKPSRQGSTYGVSVAATEDEVLDALKNAFEYDDTALIEQRIVGTEITVSVLGNDRPEALPVVEIVAKGGFFDYAAKYSQNEEVAAQEIVPARLDEETTREAQEIAVRCHRLLGCRGMSRTDMFVTDYGEIVTLEVNTIPGMTATSLLPKAAAAAGIAFPELLDKLIGYALEK